MKIIVIGLILRIILTNLNIFFIPLPGGEYDAPAFHNEALEYLGYLEKEFDTYTYKQGWMYSVFLGFIYYLFGASQFIGSILSCFVWFFSALIFREIMIKLNFNRNVIITALMIYTFLFPITILYSSFMLREVYMLLFLNILILSIVQFDLAKNLKYKFFNLILFFASSFLLVIFHKSSLVFLGLVIPILISIYLIDKYRTRIFRFELILLFFGIIFLMSYFEIFEDIFKLIYGQQEGHFEKFNPSRADYLTRPERLNLEYSFLKLITLFISNIFDYFFQPTMFRTTNILDLAALYENSLRIVIIFICLIKFLEKFEKKYLYTIIFVSMIVMEIIYAQATVNWGTATRHHMPAMGLFILMLFFPLRNTK